MLSDWTYWCSVLAKPLVSLVLRLWSLIVLSGAAFVLSDWTCWCSVLAKPLVSLVLHLWSLIALGRRAFTTKQLMPLGAVDSLRTEERHTLCLSLKQAGLLEEGINAMYKPGVQPNRNLHEVVLKLELNPETILGMAGRKDIPKVLKQIEDYIESLDADDPDYPFGHLFSDDDDKPKTKEKAPAETPWDTAKEEIKGDPREKSEVREKDKKKKRKSKKEKKEDKRAKGESGAEASEEPGRKKLKKEEEPVETGGLVTVSMEEEADYEDDHRENDDDEEADEKPVKKEESSDSESVEDPGGLEIKNENEESQDEKRSPLKLTERKTPASPERPPSWLTGDGKGKQKSKYSKGKGKHKSKASSSSTRVTACPRTRWLRC